MNISPLEISSSWLIESKRFEDNRGWFQEWFKKSTISSATGFDFVPVQTNISLSAAGTIRGIHFSTAPQGQAKLVTVMSGAIDDFIIDVRPTSPTFGQWIKVRLTSDSGNSVLLGPQLGHAFQALEENTVVSYLVTAEFDPIAEKGVTPYCPTLAINWSEEITHLVSQKDIEAPSLLDQKMASNLPD